MSEGNIEFLKAIGYIVGINILVNILPSPWGLIAFMGLAAHMLYQLYKQTRF